MDKDLILRIIWKAEKEAIYASKKPLHLRGEKLDDAVAVLNRICENYACPERALEILAYSVFLWDFYC